MLPSFRNCDEVGNIDSKSDAITRLDEDSFSLAGYVAEVDRTLDARTPHHEQEARMSIVSIAKASRLAVAVSLALSLHPAGAQVSSGDVSPTVPPGAFGNTTTLLIGNTSTGSVTVISGETLSGGSIHLGQTSTGIGTLDVSGAGASATALNHLRVGVSGLGTLNIGSGGTVASLGGDTSELRIADLAGSTGTINVNGGRLNVDSSDNSFNLNVGYRGSGTLNVTNAGRVTIGTAASGVGLDNGAFLQIGSANFTTGAVTPATGSVVVSGTGSVIEILGRNGGINVARMGSGTTGTLSIENGGQVFGNTILLIGRGRTDAAGTVLGFGATGTVIVDGTNSLLELKGFRDCCAAAGNLGDGGFIHVGRNDGTGTMTVRNGAVARLDARGATGDAGGITVGRDAGSTGTINIQSGGRLEMLSDSTTDSFGMTVGRLGSGTLTVTGGGQLYISNTGAGGVGLPFGGNLGSAAGGPFSGLFSGAGTTVVVEGVNADITVGNYVGSQGTLTIEAGAVVSAGNRMAVGHNPGASGTLVIRGNGTVINLKSRPDDTFGAGMTAGRMGTGVTTISDGAIINVDGTGGTQRHTTNVGGSGTGSGGTGTMTLTGAATRYNVTGASTALNIGRDDTETTPSTGTLTIADGAQMNFPGAGRGSVGYSPGSTGTLHVTGTGSRLNMGAFLGVGRNIDDNPGGTGLLNVASGGVVQAVDISIGTTGTVTGDGTLDASVTNLGTLSPGNSPGVLTVTGDLTLSDSSVLVLEIAGTAPGAFDRIVIGGQLHADGTLRIVRDGSYAPAIGDTFGLLAFAGRTGAFDNVVFEGFAGSPAFAASFTGDALQITAVPEPHEWMLLVAGLVMVRLASRGRRSAHTLAYT